MYQQKHVDKNSPKSLYQQHVLWYNILALSKLYNVSDNMFIIQKFEVLNGVKVLLKSNWNTNNLPIHNGVRTVHLSCKAMELGKQVYRVLGKRI